jgi:PAS domain S-box-containing protein
MAEKTKYQDFEQKIKALENKIAFYKQENENLQANENKFRFFTENLDDVVWTTNLEFKTTYTSPSIIKALGFTPEERCKQSVEDMMTPRSITKATKELFKRLEEYEDGSSNKKQIIMDIEYYKKDGSTKWMENNVKFIHDSKDQIIGLLGVSRDVARRRKAEEALKKNIRQMNYVHGIGNKLSQSLSLGQVVQLTLDSIFDLFSPDLALIFSREGGQLSVNGVKYKQSQFRRVKNFGHKVGEYLCNLAVSERKAVYSININNDPRWCQKECKNEDLASFAALPLYSEDEIIGVMGLGSVIEHDFSQYDVFMGVISNQIGIGLKNAVLYKKQQGYSAKLEKEIIERKRSEETLQASEKRFRKIIEDVSEIAIRGYDENQQVIFWNDASKKLYGYTEKEVLGKRLGEVVIPENMREQVKRAHKRWIKNKEKIPAGESVLIDKNGDDVPVFSSHVMHETPRGKEMYCIDMNLGPVKQAQKEKINAQKIASEQKKLALVGQVAGKMAHDFNNILGIIMGNAELSILDCKDASAKKTFELIFEQTLRGKNLTRNLVAFAKSQEPKQEFFRINEKIDLVLNLMKKDLEGIVLTRDHESNMPDLLADPGMIEHALVNLVQNAIHALSLVEYPTIVVKTYSRDNRIYFEILDTGCGIPEKYIDKIYEPSFTLKGSKDVSGSYKPGIKGTGYGMANVKKYIDQHKGDISIQSKVGSGTKITLTMPVIKKELTTKEKREIQKELSHFEKRILVVEDEHAISDVQYRILTQEPCNHKVDIANNGQMAFDLFDRNEYDFISLDYVLPGDINGMDVYSHIRKSNKSVPILFISGNIEFLESIEKLKHKDIRIDHVSKPCQNKDYVNNVNKLLGRVYPQEGDYNP